MPDILTLPDLAATERLARAIAPHLRAGDTLALRGDLGAGKSAFARALITARLAVLGRVEHIPSPSFTLVQVYDLGDTEIWHADLYRLGSSGEIAELGLDEAFLDAIVLVEWPERLGSATPARRLTLALEFAAAANSATAAAEDEARTATFTATGSGWDWLAAAVAEAA